MPRSRLLVTAFVIAVSLLGASRSYATIDEGVLVQGSAFTYSNTFSLGANQSFSNAFQFQAEPTGQTDVFVLTYSSQNLTDLTFLLYDNATQSYVTETGPGSWNVVKNDVYVLDAFGYSNGAASETLSLSGSMAGPASVVPEPGEWAWMLVGASGLVIRHVRRRSAAARDGLALAT